MPVEFHLTEMVPDQMSSLHEFNTDVKTRASFDDNESFNSLTASTKKSK